jgi:hypothetical protein
LLFVLLLFVLLSFCPTHSATLLNCPLLVPWWLCFSVFSCRVLVGKPEGKRPLGRPRRRWEDNINLLATDFLKMLAHPVFKMWVIKKPNNVALWNKRHFEERKMEIIQHFKIFSTDICWINIKWGFLEGNFTPVPYIGRKVHNG